MAQEDVPLGGEGRRIHRFAQVAHGPVHLGQDVLGGPVLHHVGVDRVTAWHAGHVPFVQTLFEHLHVEGAQVLHLLLGKAIVYQGLLDLRKLAGADVGDDIGKPGLQFLRVPTRVDVLDDGPHRRLPVLFWY